VGCVHVSRDVCGVHCLYRGDWEGVEGGWSVQGEAGLLILGCVSFVFMLWAGLPREGVRC
jgi:hypothetical protein